MDDYLIFVIVLSNVVCSFGEDVVTMSMSMFKNCFFEKSSGFSALSVMIFFVF